MLDRPTKSSIIAPDRHRPPEFRRFAQSADSVTAVGAAKIGVDPELFTNWRWQMANQVDSAQKAAPFLELEKSEEEGFTSLNDLFRSGVTPYYAGLMGMLPTEQAKALRLQVVPRTEELVDRLGVPDPLREVDHSPVPEVVHVYPDRVAFCVAMLCPVYCRYCYRKRRDDIDGLHFNRRVIDRGIRYLESMPAIRDVLITGGDPFIASDDAIVGLVERLRRIPHIEIIRFGTRTPVALPYRVTAELCERLAAFHPIWVNTHFNCAEELTPEAVQALTNLVDHGIPVGNQSVLLRGVNDSVERMSDLCRKLVKHRVRPYYVFYPHLVQGTEHLRGDVRRGMDIMRKMRGNISGYAIPQFIVDTPSGKVPVQHHHVLGTDGEDLLLEDLRGEIWRERGAVHSGSDPVEGSH